MDCAAAIAQRAPDCSLRRHGSRGTEMTKTQAAAAPKTAAKPEKTDIVTLRHLATEVAETHGISQKQANEVLAEAITSISKHLKKGARILHCWVGNSRSSQTRCAHGPQSCNRRSDQDQGQQEGGFPRRQRSKRSDLRRPFGLLFLTDASPDLLGPGITSL